MPRREVKETFWDATESFQGGKANGKEWKWSPYFNTINKYLQVGVKNGGIINREYRYAKNQSSGRLYVEKGGIQMLQNQIKNYVCGEYYYDFDISNCNPCILMFICNKYDIDAP